MSTQTNARWSGTSIVTGALLLIVGYWLRPDLKKELIDEFVSDTALLSSILVPIGTLLLLAGFPGLFAKQSQRSETSGLLSYGLSFIGLAAFHLGTAALYFVLPVLVVHSADTHALLYSDVPPFPRLAYFWGASMLVQVIGLLWFGVQAWRNNTYPRPATLLLLLGTIMLLAAPSASFVLVKPATTLILGALSWFGLSLLQTREDSEKQSTSASSNTVFLR